MQVLILPGLDGQAALRADFMACLAASVPTECLSYPDHLSGYDDLLPVIKARMAETDEDFVLIAESFSGPLALRIAQDPPAGLKGIIWVGSFISAPCQLPSWFADFACIAPIHRTSFRQLMNVAGFGPYGSAEARSLCADVLQDLPGKTIAARLKETLTLRTTPARHPLRMPTFALCAGEDRLLHRRTRQVFEDHGIPTELIAGPHFLLQSRPGEVAGRVRRFCGTL
ncbi:alpha/beta fold hydrolase [Thalassobius sp. I31.1]|uniref:alpha/beta fold hydrolase n=1 Tax=Thalassobius sp. I31.1 TaxID=2109912 RepID=UPI00130049AD|nr:alpha/beta fold hydrolase [Thalassobius sp. I31.1]